MQNKIQIQSLTQIITESNLEVVESKNIIEKFGDYELVAKEWEIKAKAIIVTDASQKTEMEMAKTARKKFSEMRIEIEKTRKSLKEQSLRKGQAIDAIAKFLTSLISPIEDHLRLQEDFLKIQEEKKLTEEKKKIEEQLEKERIEKEKKEAEEKERVRLENEILKSKIAEQEKTLLAEKLKKEEIEKQLKQKIEQEEKEKLQAAEIEKQKIKKLEEDKKAEVLKPEQDKFKSYITLLLTVPVPEITDTSIKNKIEAIKNYLKNC
jgi:hypothetical protein